MPAWLPLFASGPEKFSVQTFGNSAIPASYIRGCPTWAQTENVRAHLAAQGHADMPYRWPDNRRPWWEYESPIFFRRWHNGLCLLPDGRSMSCGLRDTTPAHK